MCLINGDHVTAGPRVEFIWAQWCNKGLFVEELVRSLVCHFHSLIFWIPFSIQFQLA